MSKISVLSPALANMIAAGEVVERPSSIVKELVENSIDANSKEIEIRVKDAGRSLISVRDDGDGMDKEDVLLAFTRHATSKIKTERDLFRIGSLGFRGEALPSIAAVSKVDLKSSQGSNGWKVHVEETSIKTIEPSDARKGTEIEVRELFYNTPARLKHLKSDQTELGNIIDTTNKIKKKQTF
jgi:DNA mismatch repair protein MutL